MSTRRNRLIVLVTAVGVAVALALFRPAAAPDGASGFTAGFQAYVEAPEHGSPTQPTPSESGAKGDAAVRELAATPQSGAAPGVSPDAVRGPDTSSVAPIPNADAARALMLKRRREDDCQLARFTHANAERELTDWPWMPPERVAAERAAIAAATTRLSAGCPPAPADEGERNRNRDRRLADLEAAMRSGDLHARLEGLMSGPRTPEHVAHWRATLYDAVLSGDPEAFSRIWRLESRVMPMPSFSVESSINRDDVWALVACDLGLECGPGSRVLDRACMDSRNGCGYDSLEAVIRDRSSDRQFEIIIARRRDLVERIRSGQIAGMFDPPPAPPGGG